jgi:hypothetical protein
VILIIFYMIINIYLQTNGPNESHERFFDYGGKAIPLHVAEEREAARHFNAGNFP